MPGYLLTPMFNQLIGVGIYDSGSLDIRTLAKVYPLVYIPKMSQKKVLLSLSTEQLAEVDGFAKEKGLNRSAAVIMAVQAARSALTPADVRRLAAEHFLKMDQHRLGVQEIQVDESGEIVKASEAEVEANRLRFEAERLKNLALARGAVVAPPDRRRYGGRDGMDQRSPEDDDEYNQAPRRRG